MNAGILIKSKITNENPQNRERFSNETFFTSENIITYDDVINTNITKQNIRVS